MRSQSSATWSALRLGVGAILKNCFRFGTTLSFLRAPTNNKINFTTTTPVVTTQISSEACEQCWYHVPIFQQDSVRSRCRHYSQDGDAVTEERDLTLPFNIVSNPSQNRNERRARCFIKDERPPEHQPQRHMYQGRGLKTVAVWRWRTGRLRSEDHQHDRQPAIDSTIPIAKTITSKICLSAWISKMVATVLSSLDVRTSAECQACLRHPFQNHNHYSAYILRSPKFVPLIQRPVWSASLSLPPTFLSILSRKPRVLAKVRDVFSPTASSSCVSRVLCHSDNWDQLGPVLRREALAAWLGSSLLFLWGIRVINQDHELDWILVSTNGMFALLYKTALRWWTRPTGSTRVFECSETVTRGTKRMAKPRRKRGWLRFQLLICSWWK